MRKLFLLILVVCLINGNYIFSQNDTLARHSQKVSLLKKTVVPLSLLTVGSIISSSKFEQNLQLDVRNLVGNRFNTQLDNYTRYMPLAELVIADMIGVKAKNHWFDQAKNWTISWYLTDLITFKLKDWIGKPRPDNFDNFSMPSGHTSFAFMNAEVLYNEFKETSPWLAYSGYLFATGTGTMRVMNNAHFVSDVIVGAGIAMLITKVVYWLDPIVRWNPFKKIKGVTFFPQRFEGANGFYLSVRW